nr:MAG TPA: hypothetical protein [Caudoviricetes sp.]
MIIEKFFDKTRSCWAIRFESEVEYFNHETPEHDKRNADACFKLLQKQYGGQNHGM